MNTKLRFNVTKKSKCQNGSLDFVSDYQNIIKIGCFRSFIQIVATLAVISDFMMGFTIIVSYLGICHYFCTSLLNKISVYNNYKSLLYKQCCRVAKDDSLTNHSPSLTPMKIQNPKHIYTAFCNYNCFIILFTYCSFN